MSSVLGNLRVSKGPDNAVRAEQGANALPDEVKTSLSKLDDALVNALKRGEIRLVRAEWLLAQPADYRMQYRQELEAIEQRGVSPSPLLAPDEAVALMRRGTRSIGALTYGWLAPHDPDPAGVRVRIVRKTLTECPYLLALFWDFASLFQKPRTLEQEAGFKCALGVMGDMYASAVATTVLQLKEIPPQPPNYEGEVCIFGLRDGVGEDAVRAALETFGDVASVSIVSYGAHVRFFMNADAARAIASDASPQLRQICGGDDVQVFALYNARAYGGRGWCCFESAVSSELIMRLHHAYPKMEAALKPLPPKLLLLSADAPAQQVNISAEQLATRVKRVTDSIEEAAL